MQQYDVAKLSIYEKARAERIYLHYSLLLASFLTVAGLALLILGIGDHFDFVVAARGVLETRMINSSPGFATLVLGGAIFAWSKPRKLRSSATHEETTTDQDELVSAVLEKTRKTIQSSLESRKLLSSYQLDKIVSTLNERLDRIENLAIHSRNDVETKATNKIESDPELTKEQQQRVQKRQDEAPDENKKIPPNTTGRVDVLYQRLPDPKRDDEDDDE